MGKRLIITTKEYRTKREVKKEKVNMREREKERRKKRVYKRERDNK